MPNQQPTDPVRTIPWGVLTSTPRNLPAHWQKVFEILKAPVLIANGLFSNADLMERTEEELRAKYRFLHPTFSAMSAMLDNLDVIAPQTWKAGFAIRQSLWHAWARLSDFDTRDMLGDPITPAYLDTTRKRLVELKPNFDAAALLYALREAVAAEHTIILPDLSSDIEPTTAADKAMTVENKGQQEPASDVPWPEYMSAADLARRLKLPPEATRKRLERMAEKFDCFREVESPRKGEAKKLYKVSAVLPELKKD